jgi:hypothetical protein
MLVVISKAVDLFLYRIAQLHYQCTVNHSFLFLCASFERNHENKRSETKGFLQPYPHSVFRVLFTVISLWVNSPVSYQVNDQEELPVTLQVK